MQIQVGTPVTQCHPNDRYPYQVVMVVNARRLMVQNSFLDGRLNPLGEIIAISLRDDGYWREVGTQKSPWYKIGEAEFYQCQEI